MIFCYINLLILFVKTYTACLTFVDVRLRTLNLFVTVSGFMEDAFALQRMLLCVSEGANKIVIHLVSPISRHRMHNLYIIAFVIL